MRPVPIAVGALVLIGGIFGYAKCGRPQEKGKTQYTVAIAAKGDVKKTVSATGTLKPWSTVEVKSKAGGRIDVLAVDVGSRVKMGDIIAKIDPADSLLTYDQAKASTESAAAKQSQSSETYQLTVEQASIAVDQARANVASAKASLQQTEARLRTSETETQAQPALTQAAINQAKAAYESAGQARAKLNATQTQERASAKATYDQAVANDRNAQINLERQRSLFDKGFVSRSTVDSAEANAGVTKANVASAKSKLDTFDLQQKAERDASDAGVQQALAAYQSAKINSYVITTKRNNLDENRGALEQARAAVLTAQAQLNDALAARRNGAIRKLDIASSVASVASARAQLANAKDTLDQTVVRAPSEGVVLIKSVEQGTMITSGISLNAAGTSIVTLGDVSRMYVDVAVDETDIASIHLNGKVTVTFDAFPDRDFEGKVTKINPQGVVEQNVTTVHVRVEVDNSTEGFSDLKPEMNATCDFIESEATDVITVPSEAVQSEGGESFVEIATGGKPVETPNGMPAGELPGGPPSGAMPAGGFPQGGPPPGGMPEGGPPPGELPEGMPPIGEVRPTFTDVKIERRKVTIGVVGSESTEIKEGLKEGEMVVVSKQEPKVEVEAPKGALGGGFPGGRR